MSRAPYYFVRCGQGRWPRARALSGSFAVVYLQDEQGYWVRAGRLYEFSSSWNAKMPGLNVVSDGPGSALLTVFSCMGRCHPNVEQWLGARLLEPVIESRLYLVAINSAGNWIRGTAKIRRASQYGEQVLRLAIDQADFKPGGNR